MPSLIHPTALIDPLAQLGHDVTIEAFAVLGPHVVLGDRVTVKSHAVIEGYVSIGEDTVIYPHAVLGTQPQDLKSLKILPSIQIGKRCQIREFVTINSPKIEGTTVTVGDECLIMTGCHIAHTCELGPQVIMANGVCLAGHVIVEEGAIIGGMTPIHQRCRIGRFSMVGGMSRIGHDMPPFLIGGGIPFKMGGINLVGLKRRGMSQEIRFELTRAFRLLYRSGLRPDQALDRIESECSPFPEVQHLVQFCRQTRRGLVCTQGISKSSLTETSDLTC